MKIKVITFNFNLEYDMYILWDIVIITLVILNLYVIFVIL